MKNPRHGDRRRALDALYQATRKAAPERIRTEKRATRKHDAGSTSVTILAGGHTWTLGDDGLRVIVARDRWRFDAIVAATRAAIDAHAAPPPPPPPPLDVDQ